MGSLDAEQRPVPADVEDELPTPSKAWARTVAQVAAGIVVMVMLVFAFIFWHRRRPKVAP